MFSHAFGHGVFFQFLTSLLYLLLGLLFHLWHFALMPSLLHFFLSEKCSIYYFQFCLSYNLAAPHKFWHVDYLATFSAKHFLILNIMIYFTTYKLSCCCFLMCLFNVCCGYFGVFFYKLIYNLIERLKYMINMMLTSQNLLWDLFCGWADAQPFQIFHVYLKEFIYLFLL